MKQFIKSILIFIPFAFIMYLLLLFVWGNSYVPKMLKPNLRYKVGTPDHSYSRLQEVKKIRDIDILFLGASHAYRGFDTRHFEKQGLKTFNLGSNAQSPLQTNVLLKRYLEKLNPKLIIYEVYPGAFSIDGVESALGIIANDKTDAYSLDMTLRINNAKTFNTFLYGVMMDLFNLNTKYVEKIKMGNDVYISGGYVEKELKYFKHLNYAPYKWVLNEKQLDQFNQITAYLKENNRKVIFVYAPITSNKYKSCTNNQTFDSMMTRYGNYYNFNQLIQLDDSLHFYDAQHLNQKGVDLFDNKLIELLK